MNVYFLFRNFELNKCGVSDYIDKLSFELNKNKINPFILTDKKFNSKLLTKNFIVNIDWNLLKIIQYFKKNDKGIFFLQYSPFSYSRTGFSFILIFLLFYLNFFKKDIKIVINFHEIRNRFSIVLKYFILFILHTMQFYIIYYLSHNIYYTNDEFPHDLKILNSKKCCFQRIFPNIFYKKLIKKKNEIIFFCSHFNFNKYYIFLNYIKNYQLTQKIKFKIIFIGNVDINKKYEIISLVNSFNIKNFELKFFSSNKDFSKQLSSSKVVFVTNGHNFKINSGLLVAALVSKNFFFFLKKYKNYKYLEKIIYTINNQYSFNKIINFVFKNKKINLVKKKDIIKFDIQFITKIFIKKFKFLQQK